MTDYNRPRGDITTVIDQTNRDSQDNTYFPITSNTSWFHYPITKTHPTALSIQEFTQRGPADWGQKCSFEIGTLHAGDLFHSICVQIKLTSWYNELIVQQLEMRQCTVTDPDAWTYANSLGTTIIEYAEFIVNDMTIERITGEFISTYLKLNCDRNTYVGPQNDAIGAVPYDRLDTVSANRPFPTERGILFCILPFFFARTKQEAFPLLSCNEGNVRVDIKLRPFTDVVRKIVGYRQSCDDTPLNKTVQLTMNQQTKETQTSVNPPPFQDFRIVTGCSLITGSIRNNYLRKPFEQMVKLVQTFSFEEPLKYVTSKSTDSVDIQLPLELNHPVTELIWILRRKAVQLNNEWSNFTPNISYESSPTKQYPSWIQTATIRINGSEVISAPGDWFREHIARKHKGGITAYLSHLYGFSFAEQPEIHQPTGTANMSKATSVTLNLRVNQPITTLPDMSVHDFDPVFTGGWEVFVYAMHYNWINLENGICNLLFSS